MATVTIVLKPGEKAQVKEAVRGRKDADGKPVYRTVTRERRMVVPADYGREVVSAPNSPYEYEKRPGSRTQQLSDNELIERYVRYVPREERLAEVTREEAEAQIAKELSSVVLVQPPEPEPEPEEVETETVEETETES